MSIYLYIILHSRHNAIMVSTFVTVTEPANSSDKGSCLRYVYQPGLDVCVLLKQISCKTSKFAFLKGGNVIYKTADSS